MYNVIRVPSFKLYYKEKYPIPIISSTKLAGICEDLCVDILHTHHPFGLGIPALKAAKTLNKPLVFTYHTLYEHYCHYLPVPNTEFTRYYIKKLAIDYACKCNLVIAPTKATKYMLINSGCKADIDILPTGISESLKIPANEIDTALLRNMYNITTNTPVLLSVSRLADEKNIGFILEVLALIKMKLPDVILLIVGGGPSLTKLQRRVKYLRLENNVIFAGPLNHCNVAKHYQIATVFVNSSKTETQGLPIIEALHFGLPVVSIESPANNELVGDLQTGIVTPDNVIKFSEAVCELLSNSLQLSRYHINNKITAKQFDSDTLTNKLQSIYMQLTRPVSTLSEAYNYGFAR